LAEKADRREFIDLLKRMLTMDQVVSRGNMNCVNIFTYSSSFICGEAESFFTIFVGVTCITKRLLYYF
jgi:hypothetical protein